MTKAKKVKKVLQLHNKWIRTMLTLSVLVIIGLTIYPNNGFQTKKAASETMRASEMPESLNNIRRLSTPIRLDTVTHEEMPAMEAEARHEPIPVQIIKEAEPFDWQGMITWIIGAANAVVLLIMNLKNIKKK